MEAFNTAVGNNVGLVVLILAAMTIAALIVAGRALARSGVVVRRFEWIGAGADVSTDTLMSLLNAVETDIRETREVRSLLEDVVRESRSHYKRVGLVRYDAFDGVAGQQSYSLCLLNQNNDGILISNLVGSNFNRGYALEIKGGAAARNLGEEESGALKMAMS